MGRTEYCANPAEAELIAPIIDLEPSSMRPERLSRPGAPAEVRPE
jgi:hypothetical protein